MALLFVICFWAAAFGLPKAPVSRGTISRIGIRRYTPNHRCSTKSMSDFSRILPSRPHQGYPTRAQVVGSELVENDKKLGLRERFVSMIERVQGELIDELEALDGSGKKFIDSPWTRESTGSGGGYGRTRVLEGGRVFEKAAAGVTVISGALSPERAAAMSARGRPATPGAIYHAAALSLVFHPESPLVPTFRADVRMFALEGDEDTGAWFGGGADLTPSYLDTQDAQEFHQFWKKTCDRHDADYYTTFKKECDEYFYLPARNEHRGIGGIFFDDMEGTPETLAFVTDVADSWMDSYRDIVIRHRNQEYTKEQKDWQLLRRGRYAEFNMIWDRGVRFGLLSGGDIDRIMVSAPPVVRWAYNATPVPGSKEEEIMEVLRSPRAWA
ncbi:hypothetical protein AAMO2058_000465200 [Amorphochlora amoebiformis]